MQTDPFGPRRRGTNGTGAHFKLRLPITVPRYLFGLRLLHLEGSWPNLKKLFRLSHVYFSTRIGAKKAAKNVRRHCPRPPRSIRAGARPWATNLSNQAPRRTSPTRSAASSARQARQAGQAPRRTLAAGSLGAKENSRLRMCLPGGKTPASSSYASFAYIFPLAI